MIVVWTILGGVFLLGIGLRIGLTFGHMFGREQGFQEGWDCATREANNRSSSEKRTA